MESVDVTADSGVCLPWTGRHSVQNLIKRNEEQQGYNRIGPITGQLGRGLARSSTCLQEAFPKKYIIMWILKNKSQWFLPEMSVLEKLAAYNYFLTHRTKTTNISDLENTLHNCPLLHFFIHDSVLSDIPYMTQYDNLTEFPSRTSLCSSTEKHWNVFFSHFIVVEVYVWGKTACITVEMIYTFTKDARIVMSLG